MSAIDIDTLTRYIIPASSCKNISPDQPSGMYSVYTSTGVSQVYCDMNRTRCLSCNSTVGWTQVANINLTDPNQNCPDGFRQVNRTSPPLRTCGIPNTAECVSVTYGTFGIEYSHVCGRVIRYQEKNLTHFHDTFISIPSQ